MGTAGSPALRPDQTMRLLVEVFEIFKDLDRWLAVQPGVDSSSHECTMAPAQREAGEDWLTVGRGDGFEIEWYAWAESHPNIAAFTFSVGFDAGWLVGYSLRGRAPHENEEVLYER